MSNYKVNALAPKDNWFARHLNHLHEDNESNFDLYSTCFVDGVESESSYSYDFSSYVESLHDSGMYSEFKVFNNTLYDEDFDNDQPILFCDVYKGFLHGIINPFYEEHFKFQIWLTMILVMIH